MNTKLNTQMHIIYWNTYVEWPIAYYYYFNTDAGHNVDANFNPPCHGQESAMVEIYLQFISILLCVVNGGLILIDHLLFSFVACKNRFKRLQECFPVWYMMYTYVMCV